MSILSLEFNPLFLPSQSIFLSTSPPVSPSPIKERGKKKKEGLRPLLNTPLTILELEFESGRIGVCKQGLNLGGTLFGKESGGLFSCSSTKFSKTGV